MQRVKWMVLAGSALLMLSGVLLAQPGAAGAPPDRGVIKLHVPASARVTVGGQATIQTGAERTFSSPPLTPGFTYSYDVAVTWQEGGKEKLLRRTVKFRPGQLVSADFTKAAAPKTEPKKGPGKTTDTKTETPKKKPGKKKAPEKKLDLPSLTGTVQSVDAKKGSFAVKEANGKARTFLVNESTKFVGAKGGSRGMGKAGLKDEAMVPGTPVRIVIAPDDRAALEVHLPPRKTPASKTPPTKDKK